MPVFWNVDDPTHGLYLKTMVFGFILHATPAKYRHCTLETLPSSTLTLLLTLSSSISADVRRTETAAEQETQEFQAVPFVAFYSDSDNRAAEISHWFRF